ncbi:hypothetical protein DYB37_005085 [Aphanomyces astaci]|uniref:Uncharacterized protein n=1 Tax=Aphanomyces astaci TaxID=112090 RepID=A0A3R7ERE6_APHAT|nr:hypothetical protein DYB37_005085 [Aphanomyces astaci]
MESIPVSSDHVDTCEADQAAVCIDLTEDDGIAPLPAFLWQDKSIRRVPEGWEFPAYPMDEMWFMWFCGDVDRDFRVLSPFRLLSTHDFDDAESQLRLEATQKRMFQLMEVLPLVMEGVTTADDLTVLARKDVATFEALYTRVCSAVDGEAFKSPPSPTCTASPSVRTSSITTTGGTFDTSATQPTMDDAVEVAPPPTQPFEPQPRRLSPCLHPNSPSEIAMLMDSSGDIAADKGLGAVGEAGTEISAKQVEADIATGSQKTVHTHAIQVEEDMDEVSHDAAPPVVPALESTVPDFPSSLTTSSQLSGEPPYIQPPHAPETFRSSPCLDAKRPPPTETVVWIESPLESGLSPPADLNALVADLTPGEAPARSPPERVVEASDVFNASGGAAVLPGILKSTELDYCSAPSSSDLGYAMSTAIPCRVMWKRWFIAERSSMRSPIRLVPRQDSGLSALSFQIVRNTMLWLARLYHDSTASMEASYFALVDMGPSGLDAAYDAALHRSVSHFHAPIDICHAHATVYAVHDMLAQVAPAKSSSLHGRCKSDAFFKFELFPSLSLCQVWLRWFGRGGGRQGGIPYGRWHDWEATRVSMDRLYHARRAVEAVAAIAIESRFVSSIADLETKSAGNLMDILEAVFAPFRIRCLQRRRGSHPSIKSKMASLHFCMNETKTDLKKRSFSQVLADNGTTMA